VQVETKQEFPPLFPPGFHNLTIDCLEETFVTPFVNNHRRAYLVERFKSLFKRFAEANIPAEFWLDGSFTTQKEEPDDIDLIIFFSEDDVRSITPEQISIITEVLDNQSSKIRYSCDVYMAYKENDERRSYWRGWFCFTRDEQPKGVARIFYQKDGNKAA
jgi:hypothetical protein